MKHRRLTGVKCLTIQQDRGLGGWSEEGEGQVPKMTKGACKSKWMRQRRGEGDPKTERRREMNE